MKLEKILSTRKMLLKGETRDHKLDPKILNEILFVHIGMPRNTLPSNCETDRAGG